MANSNLKKPQDSGECAALTSCEAALSCGAGATGSEPVTKSNAPPIIKTDTRTVWKAVYQCKDCKERFVVTGEFKKGTPDIVAIGNSDKVTVQENNCCKLKVSIPMMTIHEHDEGCGIAELIYFNPSTKCECDAAN